MKKETACSAGMLVPLTRLCSIMVQKAVIFIMSIYISHNCASYTPVYRVICSNCRGKSVVYIGKYDNNFTQAILFPGDITS
jgi:hypothetical protein